MTRKYNRKSKKLKKQKMKKIRSKSIRLSRKRQRTRRKINKRKTKRKKRTYKKRKFLMEGGAAEGIGDWFVSQMNKELSPRHPRWFLTWFSNYCIDNDGSLNERGELIFLTGTWSKGEKHATAEPRIKTIWSSPALLGEDDFWSQYIREVFNLLNTINYTIPKGKDLKALLPNGKDTKLQKGHVVKAFQEVMQRNEMSWGWGRGERGLKFYSFLCKNQTKSGRSNKLQDDLMAALPRISAGRRDVDNLAAAPPAPHLDPELVKLDPSLKNPIGSAPSDAGDLLELVAAQADDPVTVEVQQSEPEPEPGPEPGPEPEPVQESAGRGASAADEAEPRSSQVVQQTSAKAQAQANKYKKDAEDAAMYLNIGVRPGAKYLHIKLDGIEVNSIKSTGRKGKTVVVVLGDGKEEKVKNYRWEAIPDTSAPGRWIVNGERKDSAAGKAKAAAGGVAAWSKEKMAAAFKAKPDPDQDCRWYYIDPTGVERGPYTAPQMSGWAGHFATNPPMVKAPGETEWKPFSEYPQLS